MPRDKEKQAAYDRERYESRPGVLERRAERLARIEANKGKPRDRSSYYKKPEVKAKYKIRNKNRRKTSEWKAKERVWSEASRRRRGLGGWPVPEGSVCALCGSEGGDTKYSSLMMDHCHVTGKLRDPLCGKCNLNLGVLELDPEWTKLALSYSKEWRIMHDSED